MFVAIILMLISGVSKAVMDVCSHNFYGSKLSGLNPKWWSREDSWNNKNKYKNRLLRYLFRGPFVFVTDAWHLFQLISNLSLLLMGYFSPDILWVIGLYILRNILFEYVYSFLKKGNKERMSSSAVKRTLLGAGSSLQHELHNNRKFKRMLVKEAPVLHKRLVMMGFAYKANGHKNGIDV